MITINVVLFVCALILICAAGILTRMRVKLDLLTGRLQRRVDQATRDRGLAEWAARTIITITNDDDDFVFVSTIRGLYTNKTDNRYWGPVTISIRTCDFADPDHLKSGMDQEKPDE